MQCTYDVTGILRIRREMVFRSSSCLGAFEVTIPYFRWAALSGPDN